MPVITVSSQCGSYGPEIAQLVAERLGYSFYDRDRLLDQMIRGQVSNHTYHMLRESPRFYSEWFRDGITYKAFVTEQLCRMTASESCVLLNFGGRHFLEAAPGCLHIRVAASPETRYKRIARRFRMDLASAEEYVTHRDRKQTRFVSTIFSQDLNRAELYDAVLNTDHLSPDACSDTIYAMVMDYETRRHLQAQGSPAAARFIMDDIPEMKNRSETAFARLLDRYQVEWRYEPKSFPVEWDEQGDILTAFRPDFYLPRFDLYLELTTMDQKYVARKNRKARLAKDLYGINVKIVYRRDYNAAMQHIRQDETESLPELPAEPPAGLFAGEAAPK